MLSPRAIAMQGLGYGPRLVAMQGLWPVDSFGGLGLARQRVRVPRELMQADEDDVLLLIAAAHVAAIGRLQ